MLDHDTVPATGIKCYIFFIYDFHDSYLPSNSHTVFTHYSTTILFMEKVYVDSVKLVLGILEGINVFTITDGTSSD